MEEFFPRKVFSPFNPLHVRREPSSSSYGAVIPRGVARRKARPPEGQRYARSWSGDDFSDGGSEGEGRGSRGPDGDLRREGGEEQKEECEELRECDGSSGRRSGGGALAGATAGGGGGKVLFERLESGLFGFPKPTYLGLKSCLPCSSLAYWYFVKTTAPGTRILD